MKPVLLLLVRSQTGAATALAEIGRRRASELGLAVEVVPVRERDALPNATEAAADESVTAIVPVDFAVEQHEAWCLLCHLSLMRCDIAFSILVLGAESDTAFQARQHALLRRARVSPAPKLRRHNAA